MSYLTVTEKHEMQIRANQDFQQEAALGLPQLYEQVPVFGLGKTTHKLKNTATGLFTDHWAEIACRPMRGGARPYVNPLLLVHLAKYSSVKVNNRRMQRKFAKDPKAYVSFDNWLRATEAFRADERLPSMSWAAETVGVRSVKLPGGYSSTVTMRYDKSTASTAQRTAADQIYRGNLLR